VQAVPEDGDASFQESLLVLCGVVLEVLGEVAKAASGLDRLNGLGTLGTLELRQLRLEVGLLGRGQMLDSVSYGSRTRSVRVRS
jgi:hypothetical protein